MNLSLTKPQPVLMVALRRFRVADGSSLQWIEKGEHYRVPADQAKFHLKTKRGKRSTRKG